MKVALLVGIMVLVATAPSAKSASPNGWPEPNPEVRRRQCGDDSDFNCGHRTGLQLRRDFVCEPADQRIGDRENDDTDVVESGVDIDSLDAEFVFQARPAASTRFDVADAEVRLQQVL